MEIDDIRALSDEELEEELEDSQRGLMNLRFRVATMQLNDVNQIKLVFDSIDKNRDGELSQAELEQFAANLW